MPRQHDMTAASHALDHAPRHTLSERARSWFHALTLSPPLLVIVIFAVIAALIATKAMSERSPTDLRVLDPASATAALALRAHAGFDDRADAPPRRVPGTRAPGYALVLFGASLLDARMTDALTCRTAKRNCDSGSLATLQAMQAAAALLSLILMFVAARLLSASFDVAIMTILIAFVFGRFGELAAYPQPFVWPGLSVLATVTALAALHGSRRMIWAVAAGVAWAATALFHPFVLVALVVAVPLISLTYAASGHGGPVAILAGALLLAGAAAVFAAVGLLDAQIRGIDGIAAQAMHDFAHRVPYHGMDTLTWVTGALVPIPVIGGLAGLVLPESAVAKFGGYVPGTFAHQAVVEIAPAYLRLEGEGLAKLANALGQVTPAHWIGFVSATPVLAAKALWSGAGLLALAGVAHTTRAFRSFASGRRGAIAAGALGPMSLMLASAALLTSVHTPVSDTVVFLWAYAISYVVARP